jgi:hypothetical protein
VNQLAPKDEINVRSVVDAIVRAGSSAADGMGTGVENAVVALVRRVVAGAIAEPRPVPDETSLARALSDKPSKPTLGGASAAAVATRVARRVGPLRFLTRRTPLWLVAAAVPAVYASVTRGAEEVRLVASHLVRRARSAGGEPDAERLRRAVVHLLLERPMAPQVEPRHTELATRWLTRAFRAALPFGGQVATREPDRLAAAAAAVDVADLQASSSGGVASSESRLSR